ncbi:MAG: acyltransferase [Conexibacter sp.]|nr:acyltransferase [Conexibacter sp.]
MVQRVEPLKADDTFDPAPQALAPPPGNPRFPQLDGLRAIAALAVFLYHVNRVAPFPGFLGKLAGHGNFGVVLFFLLSGFLLYRPSVSARAGRSRAVPARTFYARRALRIVPAYVVALAALAIWPGLDGFGEFWWRHFTFTQIYWNASVFTGIHVAWSLCVEVSFYALLPLYVLATRRWRPTAAVELALLAGLAIASAGAHQATASKLAANWGFTLPTTFYLFAVGMAVAVLDVHLVKGVAGLPYRRLAWPAAAALFVLIAAATDSETLGAVHPVYAVVALLVLIPATDSTRIVASRPARILEWGGLISYAFYLYHEDLVTQLGRELSSPWSLTAVALAATVAAATASYYVIEQPALRLKRALR